MAPNCIIKEKSINFLENEVQKKWFIYIENATPTLLEIWMKNDRLKKSINKNEAHTKNGHAAVWHFVQKKSQLCMATRK